MNSFVRDQGRLFFLGNTLTLAAQPVRNLRSSLLPFRALKPWTAAPRTAPSVAPKVMIKSFHSTGQLSFARVYNYNRNNRNLDTLKKALIFSGLFVVGTTLVTPYLFQYTPLSYFNRNPRHLVYGIIGINAAVFGVWQVPKYWRLLSRYALLEKDSMYSKWSIIGSTFSHQEFWHLGVNMLGLYSFGSSLASIVGASTFTQLYLNAGVIASLVSIAYPIVFKIPAAAASLGASGALFGVFGAFAYLIPTAKIMLFVFPIPGGAWVAFLGACAWNAAGCVMRWGSFDYAAHLGGSMVGVMYGWWISKRMEQQRSRRAFRY